MNQTIHCTIDKKTFYNVNIKNILSRRLVTLAIFAAVILINSLINPGLLGNFYYTVAGLVIIMFYMKFKVEIIKFGMVQYSIINLQLRWKVLMV